MDQQEEKKNVDPDLQFEELVKKIRDSGHNMDLGRIRAAYEMARTAHAGQFRQDGSR
jgi:(p)ppGpp synthase/HD superfamily hydrolase